jgi:hypothetical protein
MITHVIYVHKDKPYGDRFRQSVFVPLPTWAVVRQFEFRSLNIIARWVCLA